MAIVAGDGVQNLQVASDAERSTALGSCAIGNANGVADRVADTVKVHKWLILLLLAYTSLSWIAVSVLDLVGVPGFTLHLFYSRTLFLMTTVLVLGFLAGYCIYVMIVKRPDRLFHYLGRDLAKNWFTPERITGVVIIYALLPFGLATFSTVKSTIPFLNPYSWDEAFMQLDRMLHFGLDPWRILQPLMGYPWLTYAIDSVYISWFFIIKLVIFWQAFSVRDLRLRLQFFITLFLVCILLGNLLAVMLSSTGPVYFGRVTGLHDHFAPLMNYLYRVNESYNIVALQAQTVLWDGYVAGEPVGGGISAMPSLHIAIAVLLVLVGYRAHPAIGGLFAVYAVLIFVGSVHLGWHYAVDGYVSIVLTWVIWLAVGKLQDRAQRYREASPSVLGQGS